jgi:hypothetical protein
MDRRRFLLTSLVGALAAPLAAEAQPAGKVWRIGILTAVVTPVSKWREAPLIKRARIRLKLVSRSGAVEGV